MSKRRKEYFKKLTNRYRIVILNEQSYEEKTAFALTPLNLLMLFSFVFVVFFLLTYLLWAFSPLKELLPGQSYYKTVENEAELRTSLDSLKQRNEANEHYLQIVKNVLTGEVANEDTSNISKAEMKRPGKGEKINLMKIGKDDSILRTQMENQDKYDLTNPENKSAESKEKAAPVFYPPVKGIITQHFNPARGHYAIDIVSKPEEGIKAVMDGTVIFTGWTAETGHVIMLQHANNLVSVYKHNSVLLKKVGTFVHAGEVIAIIGNTGELSTGPHLHFELWQNGKPLDPEKFIVF